MPTTLKLEAFGRLMKKIKLYLYRGKDTEAQSLSLCANQLGFILLSIKDVIKRDT